MSEEKDSTAKRRTILLGLDGATFDILDPWMKAGHLPNLAEMVRKGVSGELASTTPPTTPPAWAAAVTGKNPGKHGIFDFQESPLQDFERPLVSGKSIKARRLWQMLNARGERTLMVNVPLTYPPEKVNGFVISGMMTPGPDAAYANPPEVKERLLRAIGDYVPNIDIPKYDVELKEDALRFMKDVVYSFEKRRDAFFYFLDEEKWDFFMIVFILTDRIQHLFWKYMDPESRIYNSGIGPFIREKILNAFRVMDGMFGALMRKLDRRTDLIVLSDHGFGTTHGFFNVNTWLSRIGLLKVNPKGFLKKRLFYTAMVLNDSRIVKTLVPKSIQSKVRRRIRGSRSTLKSSKRDVAGVVDWSQTKAYFASIPAQGIFINIRKEGTPGIVSEGKECEEVCMRIREGLERLDFVDEVKFREEVYSGPQTLYAPHVLFKARNYGILGRQLLGGKELVRPSTYTPNGFHRPNGIFMALGENFKKGARIQGASIMDITPTVLYSRGFPLPDDMDGRVLLESFQEGYVKEHPVKTCKAEEYVESEEEEVYSDEDQEKLRKRLKGLGYIE